MYRLYALIFTIFSLCFLCLNTAHALELSNIRIGSFDNQTRFVVDLSENINYRVFLLDSPQRVVIDLPRFDWQITQKKVDPTGLIKQYRHGQFDQSTSRIVLDLNKPIEIKNTYILKPEGKHPYRFVIDMQETSVKTFQAALKNSYGILGNPVIKKTAPEPKKPTITLNETAQKKKPMIVIDAGHGGKDPGAIAKNGIFEKNITLLAAKNLRNTLLKTGRYRVKLTRETDVFHKLRNRYKIARDNNADMFISLHADSISDRSVVGASVYTLSQTASDKETAKLAERENKSDAIAGFDLTHEDEDVADILIDLTVRDTMNQSKVFADTLVKSFKSNGVNTLRRPHRYAGFAVLKAPDIPSVLIELGFISSPREAKRLNTTAYRSQLSKAILGAIDQYFTDGMNNLVF